MVNCFYGIRVRKTLNSGKPLKGKPFEYKRELSKVIIDTQTHTHTHTQTLLYRKTCVWDTAV